MKRVFIAIAVLIVTMSAELGRAGDWPGFRGANGDGVAVGEKINLDWKAKAPTTMWTVPLSDNGYAGPAVAGGKVFIVDHKDKQDVVRALELEGGKEVWTFEYPDAAKNRYGFTVSTPLVADGRVYVLSRLGKLHCLDAKDGAKVWSRDLLAEFGGVRPEWDYAMAPVLYDGKLIVLPGGKGTSVAALDPATGKTLWQSGDSKAGYATPVIAKLGAKGTETCLAFLAEGLVGLDPQTGQRLWAFPWKTAYDQNAATPLVVDGSVFIATAHGHGCAMLDIDDGAAPAVGSAPTTARSPATAPTAGTAKARWQNKAMMARFQSPVLLNGRIYGGSEPEHVVCMDPKTGKVVWSAKGFEFASVLAVGDYLLARDGKSGAVVLVDGKATEYTELGRMTPVAGPNCWSPLVLSDGRLLVRNTKSLVCVDMR